MMASLETKDWVLAATALTGASMGLSHFLPLAIVMLPLALLTFIAQDLARQSALWGGVAAVWLVAVLLRRHDMEDHVYVYLAWLVAVAVALLDQENFVELAGRQGRRIIAVVFSFATFWKLVSGEFVTGSALWTLGLFDDRLGPLMRAVGISADSYDSVRPAVTEVARGEAASFDIELSSFTNLALIAVSLGTLVLEALIAVTHAVPNKNRLARWRVPALVLFGLVTYSIVPVFSFAFILAVMGATAAHFDRRSVIALMVMVLVTLIRFATL